MRLLPMSDQDKDIEILALRHQLIVLQRQVGKPVFTQADRMVLAGLLRYLPPEKLRKLLLLVRPDTLLRWHRDLIKRRHAATCAPKRRGRPRTVRSIRALVLRLARENSSWGYRRIHGELAALGIKVAASTVWEILNEHGVAPAPERDSTTWTRFLHDQGAHTTYLGPEGSHIGREESVPDTARVLGRMFDGIEFPGLPTWAAGGPARLDHRHGRRPVAAHRGRTGRSGPGSGVAWEGAKQIMSADQGHGVRVLEDPLTNKGTAFFEEEQHAQRSDFGEGLPRRGPPAPPPHSQGTQEKGTEEHDNADDQQINQALDDDTHDAEHDRHDHEEEEEGKHLMLRSVVLVSGGPVAVHR